MKYYHLLSITGWAALAGLSHVQATIRPTPSTVWTDLEIIHEQVEYARRHRRLQVEEGDELPEDEENGMVCGLAIELFDHVAPQNVNRECSCNVWTQSIECNYKSVICRDKVLPSVDVVLDLGILGNKVLICQEFMEEEFEQVCIEADLTEMKYSGCQKATMGRSFGAQECSSCKACEDGLTLDIDCTNTNPLAATNGCQRVFFEDSCLDFIPTALPDDSKNTNEIGAQNNQNQNNSQVIETPQQQAIMWSQSDNKVNNSTTAKQIQRYAMAAFYYATTMFSSNWTNATNWLSFTADECDWYSVSEESCTSKGELESLDLADNSLSGPLNPEIGLFHSLKYLNLPYNYLSGTMPTTVGLLTKLIDLDIHHSNLNGTIPTELGLLTNLGFLSLSDNWFEGKIPSELGLLTNASTIELYGNSLSGTIPREVCQLISKTNVQLFVDCGKASGIQCNQRSCNCVCS